MIPPKYTCDDADVSPPLQWSDLPEETETIAVICDDPDAPMGTWVHWVLYNVPANVTELEERISPVETLPTGALQGKNDFGRIGYGGPCPPGGTHRYFFKVYALNAVLNVQAGISKADLLQAMEGHVLAQSQLMGRYTRE